MRNVRGPLPANYSSASHLCSLWSMYGGPWTPTSVAGTLVKRAGVFEYLVDEADSIGMHAAAAYAQLGCYATFSIPDEMDMKYPASSHRFLTFLEKRCPGICSSIFVAANVLSPTFQRVGTSSASNSLASESRLVPHMSYAASH